MLRSVRTLSPRNPAAAAVVQFSSDAGELRNDEVNPFVYNHNPRNLERLRVAYKPAGYHLEAKGREFWHKLLLEQTSRIIRAHVMHNSGVMVVSASTSEWAITRHLYRNTDMAAFINLARVFGVRCMESGITEMMCDLQRTPGGKVEAFVSELERTGISLTEPPRFKPWRPWDQYRPEKPWEVTE
ncbi:large ribosomal subunit protein uL18m isoform X1 [Anabrus simplex]|uniref:large ribosomal subunit protein uL18m isoform X1 n=1 Tax=Anabrus simplex TaxID=316456 RepID=UPI0035A29E57